MEIKMSKKTNGFTIIEILVVIAIIGILAAIGITSFTKIQIQARDKDRSSKATILAEALEKYYEQNGEYPNCSNISGVSSSSAAATLGNIDPNVLTVPSASDGVNSISCSDLIDDTDTFAYVSVDQNSYTLKYKEEGTTSIKEVSNRHTAFNALEAPNNPTVTVTSPDGINVQATVASVTCASGTAYYAFSSRTNGGAWSAWSSWDKDVLTSSQSATDGTKYGYRAEARCQVPGDETQISAASVGLESTYIDPIGAPSAPVVSASTVGSTTTWSWPAVVCAVGTVQYQYDYTITPSGYDSGWHTTNDLSIAFTTSTEGQTYRVYVQARCSNANAVGAWSASGNRSYYRPVSWKQISTGYRYTCGIKTVGDKAYCWGENGNGQLGINSTTDQSVPTAVYTAGVLSGLTIKSIYAGYTHTCAIASNDAAYCWGLNNYGQLGDNSVTQRTAPVLVSGGLTWKALAPSHSYSARHHTCGITSTNLAYCWGGNNYGQLGTNSTTQRQVPYAVYTSGVLSGKTILKIASGGDFSCVVANDNYAYCWGYNSNGQIGDNSTSTRTAPVAVNKTNGTSSLYNKVVSDISAGAYHTCAYASDGKAHCWGLNDSGQLGINSTSQKLVPNAVIITGSLSGKTINSIQNGDSTTCVTATDNTAHCWGYNYYTQLGLGDSYFDDYYQVPMIVDQSSGENGYIDDKTISKFGNTLGSAQSCLLSTEGVAYCSGANDSGESGDGRSLGQYSPSYWPVDDPL